MSGRDLHDLELENEELRKALTRILESRTWRWTGWLRRLARPFVERTDGSRSVSPTDPPDHACLATVYGQPLISILTPIFNPAAHHLREAIVSVLKQCYRRWELILVHDGPVSPETLEIMHDAARSDNRIKIDFLKSQSGISAATNRALAIASGDFIALLDHDDLLAPHALCEVVKHISLNPEADMIYTDEDKVTEAGKHRDPFYKPDWSPELLLSQMYTCHLGVYRRGLAIDIGGFRSGFDGSQDYDFVLRLTEKARSILHIPRVLYHWRIHPASAAGNVQAKPWAYENARRTIAEALDRRNISGDVRTIPGLPGIYRVNLTTALQPLVSIIIPTRNGRMLGDCLRSIFKRSTYKNFEIIVVDNGSDDPATLKIIDKWCGKPPHRVVRSNIPFNHSTLTNIGVQSSSGDLILLLNDDVRIETPDWLEQMAGYALRPDIGAVGCLLTYPSGKIQHVGTILGIGGIAGHVFTGMPSDYKGHFGRIRCTANYSAVTAACMMVERKKWTEVGGLDEKEFSTNFNDVDLCLKLGKNGYRTVVLPFVRNVHHESATRRDTHMLAEATVRMRNRWGQILERDPYYNPNLSLDSSECIPLCKPRY